MQVKSQNAMIKRYLLDGNSLTALDALVKFGCLRLSARIYDLRYRYNLLIDSREITLYNGKRVKEYFIKSN